MAGIACHVGKHGELRGSLRYAGELEPGVARRAIAGIGAQRIRIARLEHVQHGAPALGIVDDDEAPGLAQAHGRRKARRLDQAFQRPSRQWIGAKAPYIAAPDQKLAQAYAESVIEARWDQYSVALSRSGAARSCSGPPILPWVRSARMVPELGRLLRPTCRDGSHSFERTIALAHW